MITEAISQGQAAQAGRPTSGRNTSATMPEPIEISVVIESGSSPTLISAFQPAWQSAANSTLRKTRFSTSAARGGRRPQLGAGARILHRPRHLGAERLGRVPAPMRIVEETARHRHHIGLALRHDRLGMFGLDDKADGTGSNAGFLLDPRGDRHVVARLTRGADVGGDAAGRTPH